jgi:hypothetical protein
MTICVSMGLSLRITEKLFDKSNNKLDYYTDPDKTYIHIMETMPGLPLSNFNDILEEFDIPKLGSETKE